MVPPWAYGYDATETQHIYVFCTAVAFISKSAFLPPSCMREGRGGFVYGRLEPANGGPESAQLEGWGLSPIGIWRAAAPHTLPPINGGSAALWSVRSFLSLA